jgi:hypothetical protein
MTRDEQIKLVMDFSSAIVCGVVKAIHDGKVPAHWDGFELRQILADKFASECRDMGRARKSDYKNTVAITPGL